MMVKPTKAIKQMAALESSSDLMPNAEESNTRLKISIKSVKAAGSAFLKTVSIKCPLMRSLLGSSARKNPGIPIVSASKGALSKQSLKMRYLLP